MENNEKISVIVPVYNNEKYINKCIESIVKQTYKNLEIILVDDGSDDNSYEILKKFATEDCRIKVIKTQHKGVSNARNTGLKYASCPLVTFVDCDDFLDVNAYETIIKKTQNINSIDLICFGIKILDNSNSANANKDKEYYKVRLEGFKKKDNNIFSTLDSSCCNKIFKKDIIVKNKIYFPNNLHYEDTSFCIKYLVSVENLFFLKDKMYYYRRRKNSIMSQTFKGCDFAIEHLYILIDIYNYMEKMKKIDAYFDVFVHLFISFFNFSLRYSTQERKKEVLDCASYLASSFFKNKKVSNSIINNLIERDFEKIFEKKLKFYQKIFCIKNSFSILKNKKEKYIYFLGKKFEIDANEIFKI